MTIRPQSEFPLIDQYKAVFPITDETIFAYDDDIFVDGEMSQDLLVHELRHIRQQKDVGLQYWVEQYLNNVEFRLQMEIDAYRAQLRSISQREQRNKVMIQSAKTLCSPLYQLPITMKEALKALKI